MANFTKSEKEKPSHHKRKTWYEKLKEHPDDTWLYDISTGKRYQLFQLVPEVLTTGALPVEAFIKNPTTTQQSKVVIAFLRVMN